jgi:hypothetical protein
MTFTINDISIYFFNWKKTNLNVCKLYKDASKIISNTCIINSDENYQFEENMNVISLNDLLLWWSISNSNKKRRRK